MSTAFDECFSTRLHGPPNESILWSHISCILLVHWNFSRTVVILPYLFLLPSSFGLGTYTTGCNKRLITPYQTSVMMDTRYRLCTLITIYMQCIGHFIHCDYSSIYWYIFFLVKMPVSRKRKGFHAVVCTCVR